MALVNMRELIARADAAGVGVGAFNVGNMEMIMGVVKAAEELDSPVIMQIAEGRLPYSPLHIIGPAMVAAAKASKVDIAVHLDHGSTFETIRQALDIGFTSVMFDGSSLPYEDNVRKTKEVVAIAGAYGAAVECEIGVVGGNEGGDRIHQICYSDPHEAMLFSKTTGADAMAVAIGNAHGLYSAKPELRFDILEEIRQRSALPLVLHGGSGITDGDFQEAIRCGIRKVNIATASFMNAMSFAREYLNTAEANYFGMSSAMVEGTYENAAHHINVFNMAGIGSRNMKRSHAAQ